MRGIDKSYIRYLDPKVISKIKGLDLIARMVVEGFLVGLHRSPYHGFSVEFAEHREYRPGDELRYVDWKVFGKTDRYYVKVFEEETNLKAYLIIDKSGSMGFRSNGISKLEYVKYLASALSFLLLRQKDAVGLLLFSKGLDSYTAPSSRKNHLNILLKELDQLKPGGETSLANVLFELAEKIKRRGLIILFSDLFDDYESVIKALKIFRHKKNEVLVFHTLDSAEILFPFSRDMLFRDMETNEKITVDPKGIRKEYREKINNLINSYKRDFWNASIDYQFLRTDTPYDKALLSYLAKRKKMR
ncbi:MAG: DUF58 domain-containing protein [Candidatus Cloacimonadota bacterium]|nr:MAG: DUF58 domain-containing protein [Candidatus Cloacimonadota bacterium]